ncbi:glutaminyl-peptide cyclotransferase isoform X2 [Drosophila biarmipes]|uniref:glutaminyl-peptide cyclotransferase isoform X2 n=1 Tax=Drosophila biarmipes TaxID=125945 RepID=UPI0021CCAF96|nr:glutaminyl-peptide cyclotransferase isoform X2 [Drosophila biarmipes]
MFGRIAFILPFVFFDDEDHFNATLAKLLKPRFVGSQGHSEVRDFIHQELQRLDFTVVRNEFQEGANFTNLLGFWNTEAEHVLMLTCHYDSKKLKDWDKDIFPSATEAVPCAILLNLAKTLGLFLAEKLSKGSGMGLALIFFDGHNPVTSDNGDGNELIGSGRFIEDDIITFDEIALVLTLSYIGAPNQTFNSYFEASEDLHELVADMELELRKSGQLTDCHVLFQKKKQYDDDLLDDHVLFHEMGVPVMHVAPQEYPKVLHTAADTQENLHYPTIRNTIKIMRRLVYEFLEQWDSYIAANNIIAANNDLDNNNKNS